MNLKKGGSIRYLIAVLLSAFLTILLVNPSKATSTKKHINNQVSGPVKTSSAPIVEKKVEAQIKPGPKPAEATKATSASGCDTYRSTFALYWSGSNLDIALAICQAESGGNPYAVSSTNDYGLMQLHDEEIFDPSANIAGAYRKYEVQGWGAWTTYNTGAYTQFL